MSSTTLNLGLILGYKGTIEEVNFFDKTLFLLSAPSVEGLLFNLQKMTIFNCNEKPICISAGQDHCTFVLNSKSEHLVLTQVKNRNLLNIGIYQEAKPYSATKTFLVTNCSLNYRRKILSWKRKFKNVTQTHPKIFSWGIMFCIEGSQWPLTQ